MTAQISERLVVDGVAMRMGTEPLAEWLSRRKNRSLRFKRKSTACSRGYVGSWAVSEGHLYLVHIAGELADGSIVTLETLFPGSVQKVLASWFSGMIDCPEGRMISYRHYGHASVHERSLCLRFHQGVLVDRRSIVNDIPDKTQIVPLSDLE
jgi:hypothetical protein